LHGFDFLLKNDIAVTSFDDFRVPGLGSKIFFIHSGDIALFDTMAFERDFAEGHFGCASKLGESGVLGQKGAVVRKKQGYCNPFIFGCPAQFQDFVEMLIGTHENTQGPGHKTTPLHPDRKVHKP